MIYAHLSLVYCAINSGPSPLEILVGTPNVKISLLRALNKPESLVPTLCAGNRTIQIVYPHQRSNNDC